MAHCIIKPYDTVYTPAEGLFADTWHHLNEGLEGGIFRDGSNIQRVLRPIHTAGFRPDFNGEVSTLSPEAQAELGANPISDWKVLLADLREDGNGIIPVHVAKAGYKVHQNADLFNAAMAAMDSVFGKDGYTVATVGTLGAYSQFFLSIALKNETVGKVGEKDEYRSFFNVISSHNSLVASSFGLGMVRIVCMNTILAALQDQNATGYQSSVKHTVNSGNLITPEAIEAAVRSWITQKEKYFQSLAMMKTVPMNDDAFKAFASGVFTNDGSDELSTNSFNRVQEMTALFRHGRGNSGVSLYDAVNAFTEYFTSGNGLGKSSSPAKRLASANFGRGNEWKLEAMRVASDETILARVMKRGEILFSDKEKTVVMNS